MNKQTKSNRQTKLMVIFVAIFSIVFGNCFEVAAQNQSRKYKPGDMLEDGAGYVYKIIRCYGESEWDECEYQAYLDGKPTGASGQKMTIRNLRAMEQRVLDAKRREAESRGETTNANSNSADRKSSNRSPDTKISPLPSRSHQSKTPSSGATVAGLDGKWKVGDKLEVNDRAFWYPAQIIAIQGSKYKVHFEGYPSSDDKFVDESRMRPVGGHQITAECSYDFPGDTSPAAKPSEQLFKKKIWQRYSFRSKKAGSPSISAPDDIGTVFLTFQLGKSYTNIVGNAPGGGASRINNGAPVNATIYPVKTKYVVCNKYSDGTERFLYEESMACFKDKYGEWICEGEGVPKRTKLDQE